MSLVDADGTEIDDAVANWLVCQDAGLSPEDETALRTWLAESPVHESAWHEATVAWNAIGDLPEPLIDALRRDALQARAVRRLSPMVMAACAGIVLFLAIGSWFLLERPGPGSAPVVAVTTPVTFAAGAEQRTIRLADGSNVLLDARSEITATLRPERRDVQVRRGRAFFEVKHDSDRPFVVAAGDVRVTATGTGFSVSFAPKRVEVILENGHVLVTGIGRDVAMVPGQRYLAVPGAAPAVTNVSLARDLVWRSGYLEFDNATLDQAVDEINRYARTPIRLADPALGQRRVSGRFKAADTERFADAIAVLQSLKVGKGRDGTILLKP